MSRVEFRWARWGRASRRPAEHTPTGSVLTGDARALIGSVGLFIGSVGHFIGSVGLFGLALPWALQAPIESFTGWLLNSFRSYYTICSPCLLPHGRPP